MIFPSNRVRIVVATRPVDFRKGHDGLAAVVKRALRRDPFTGTVFASRLAKPRCCSAVRNALRQLYRPSPRRRRNVCAVVIDT